MNIAHRLHITEAGNDSGGSSLSLSLVNRIERNQLLTHCKAKMQPLFLDVFFLQSLHLGNLFIKIWFEIATKIAADAFLSTTFTERLIGGILPSKHKTVFLYSTPVPITNRPMFYKFDHKLQYEFDGPVAVFAFQGHIDNFYDVVLIEERFAHKSFPQQYAPLLRTFAQTLLLKREPCV